MKNWYAKIIAQSHTRGIVSFNFCPRNLTQVTSAMKPGKECMVGICFGKENNSSRRVILKIEPELNILNSILSRSAVTPVFPTHLQTHIQRHTPLTLALMYTRSLSACTQTHTHTHTHRTRACTRTNMHTHRYTHIDAHEYRHTYANTTSRYVQILTGARYNCINTYITRHIVSYVFS